MENEISSIPGQVFLESERVSNQSYFVLRQILNLMRLVLKFIVSFGKFRRQVVFISYIERKISLESYRSARTTRMDPWIG